LRVISGRRWSRRQALGGDRLDGVGDLRDRRLFQRLQEFRGHSGVGGPGRAVLLLIYEWGGRWLLRTPSKQPWSCQQRSCVTAAKAVAPTKSLPSRTCSWFSRSRFRPTGNT